MGLLSSIGKVFKTVTKPIKKVIKSPVGLAALAAFGLPAYARYAPQTWMGRQGILGPGSQMAKLGQYLYGSAQTNVADKPITQMATKGLLTKHPAITAGIGTAAAAGLAAPKLEEEIDIDIDDPKAHADYLTNRGQFEDEWAEWLVTKGDADTKEEALIMVRENPMFSGGGRVKAQGGLFAGQMPGRHPTMNPMNQMNQGLGAPNLGPRSMGMTPGMDPRMAQLMQQRKLQGATRTGAVPKESADTELIQLIKMLTTLGIPMEQLRGRTKEELVEMLVSVKGKTPSGPDVKETASVIEEEDVREAQEVAGGGLMRTGYAMGTEHPIIPSKDGQQLDMRQTGGYQPHGKAEKHDDVRALLAQGEFVMTSDAVKGMGGGDRDLGAKKMYNLMHNMEAMA